MTSITVPSLSGPGDIPHDSSSDVRPHPHNPTQWQVRSRGRGDAGLWHDVDALNEECSCEHFQWRLDDRPQGTLTSPNEARWCYHLRKIMTAPVRDLLAVAAAYAAPLPLPLPAIEGRHCPTCGGPSAEGYIYCTVSRFGRGYCPRGIARLEEASI